MKYKIVIPWIISMMIVLPVKAQWTDISIPNNVPLSHGQFIDDLTGFVSSYNYHVLWRTSNGGVSWDSTEFTGHVYDVDFSDAQNGAVLLFTGANYEVEVTSDGGLTWNNLNFIGGPFTSFNGIMTTDPNHYILSSFDFILKTSNAGTTWDTIMVGGYPMSMDKEKIDDDTLLFTGWDGTFMYEGQVTRSYDGGTSWTFINTGDDYTNFDGSYFINGMHGFAVYRRGWGPDTAVISYTNDGGSTWNENYFDTSITFHDVFMKSATEGYVTATEGMTGKIQFTNNGITYTDDYTSADIFSRLYHASNTLYAIGTSGKVIKKNVPLGILDNEIIKIEMYPNPAQNEINFSGFENSLITIYDLSGKLITTEKLNSTGKLNIEVFSAGLYYAVIESEGKIYRGDFQVMK